MIDAKHSTTGHPLHGRRPADRLLLPGPHLRDRHARARPRVARRDLGSVPRLHADRPRRGLRDDAHLVERRHHRPVRGDPLRRQRHQVPVQRPVPDDGHVQRRDLERRSGHVPHHRARSGDRLRDGQGPRGGDLLQALELRQGRARPALLPPPVDRAGGQPAVVLQRGVAHAADVQLVLHRQQARRRVHEREASGPAEERRPRSADRGHRAVRVARVLDEGPAHPRRRSRRRDDDQLEQHLRPRVRRRGRQLGRQRLGCAGGPAEPEPRSGEELPRQVGPRRQWRPR